MIERVIFTSEADEDVVTAYAWHEKRDPGLGEEFLRSLTACTSLLQRHPQLYPIAVDNFRRALLRRFPYELFYEASADVIVIYAVFHTSQDPQKWHQRLRG